MTANLIDPRNYRYSPVAMPSGVIRITNGDPNYGGNTGYVYRTPGGPAVGSARWNPGTGGYFDATTGRSLDAMGSDRASAYARATGALEPVAAPAFYGDSYGGIQGAAQSARNRQQSFDLAQIAMINRAQQDAAARADRAAEITGARNFQSQQSLGAEAFAADQAALNRAAYGYGATRARVPGYSNGGGGGYLPGYDEGGYVDGPIGEPAGIVHGGEVVIPADQVDQTTKQPMDDSMRFNDWRKQQVDLGLMDSPGAPPPFLGVPRAPAPAAMTPLASEDQGRWLPTIQRGVGRDGAPVLLQVGWHAVGPNGEVRKVVSTNNPIWAPVAASNHARNMASGRTYWDPHTQSFQDGGDLPAFRQELTPVVQQHAAITNADNATKAKAAVLSREFNEHVAKGDFAYDTNSKSWVPAPGHIPTTLEDGTPIPPELLGGIRQRALAKNAIRLKTNLDETAAAEDRMVDLRSKLKDSKDQVAGVIRDYSKSGLRFKPGLVPVDSSAPGPGFIYRGTRPVAPVAIAPPQVPAVVAAPAIDPLVAKFNAMRAAAGRAYNARFATP